MNFLMYMISDNIEWSSPSKPTAFLNDNLKRLIWLRFFILYTAIQYLSILRHFYIFPFWEVSPIPEFHVYYAMASKYLTETGLMTFCFLLPIITWSASPPGFSHWYFEFNKHKTSSFPGYLSLYYSGFLMADNYSYSYQSTIIKT